MRAKSTVLFLLAVLPIAAAYGIEPNQPAPDFTLSAYGGSAVKLSELKDKVVVLEWFNSGCPFVQKHYKNGDMQALQKQYKDKGIVWLTVNSTHKEHSDYLDSKKLEELLNKWQISATTMLEDASGKVGKSYGAKTTPHMYVINKGVLVYNGAIDDNSDPSSDPKEAKNYIESALDEVLAGKKVSVTETKPYGCSIKYES